MKRCITLFLVRNSKPTTNEAAFESSLLHKHSLSNSSYLPVAPSGLSDVKNPSLCSRILLLLSFLISGVGLSAQVSNTTIFPLNDYLTTEKGSPYPILVQSKLDEIDKSKFVNVMDYGAKGDGETWDDEAIERAFTSARYGVIFPANKTFLVHKLTRIQLNRDITVYAYGATIKMDDFSRYSFLSLEYEEGSYHNTVIWLGGKLSGNQTRQSWPGSPTGKDTWEEEHGRFLGICYASFALVKDVTVDGPVMDGVGLESCKIAVFADSKAYGGAPIKYSEVQDQGTYFKCTRYGSQAFYCMNLDCDGGSIGVHYSTKSVEDKSLTVVTNSRFNNQSQDAMHFEDCKKIFLYKCTVERDVTEKFQADVHISNSAEIASIKSCQFKNARVDFRNATDLQIGVVDSCQFVSEFTGSAISNLNTLVGGATHCINSSFTGETDEEQVWADNVQNCDFTNYNNLALRGPHVTDNSYFEQGNVSGKQDDNTRDKKSISPAKNGVVINCTFDNNEDADYRKPDNRDWKEPFSSSITIISDKDKYLGIITCGGNTDEKNTTATSITTATATASSPLKRSVHFNGNGLANNNQMITGDSSSIKLSATNNKNIVQSGRISLYPNPSVNEVHVNLNEKVWGKTVLNVYDQQGRLVQTKTIYKNTPVIVETISAAQLTSGAYVLQIINEHEKSALKFVIAR